MEQTTQAPAMQTIHLRVNGQDHELSVRPRRLLVDLLRYDLGLTGTKEGCSVGVCGACTVLLDGKNVASCIMPAVFADGAEITTIEGLATNGTLHPVQEAFHTQHGRQCGFCTAGRVMASVSLIEENDSLTETQVRHGLEGNLCRCTGYHNIIKAVLVAAGSAEVAS